MSKTNLLDIMDLSATIRELKELKLMEQELQDEITALEDTLKAVMVENDAVEMTVDCFKLRYKTVQTSRFDSAAFKKTHADLYDQYAKPTEYRRFTVV